MRLLGIVVVALIAIFASGCDSGRVQKCSETYAGTIGIDGCRTSESALRSDGQFKDLDRHCELWTAYHKPTGRCRGWKSKQKYAHDDSNAPSN